MTRATGGVVFAAAFGGLQVAEETGRGRGLPARGAMSVVLFSRREIAPCATYPSPTLGRCGAVRAGGRGRLGDGRSARAADGGLPDGLDDTGGRVGGALGEASCGFVNLFASLEEAASVFPRSGHGDVTRPMQRGLNQ